MADLVFQCGACDHEMSGYSKTDLLEAGWVFEDAKKGRQFPMCGECVEKFARRRQARQMGCACKPGEECFICTGKSSE